ncbi:SelB domain-containing protein, partial [Bacillus licheniformis]|uniref:SelB domain-containing protein n=1 Tax=Bacillus licheniformis TaxID=1402 RepID=UPI0016397937
MKQNDLLEKLASNKKDEMKQWKDYLIAMIRSGEALKIGDDLIISKSLLEEAQNRLTQFLKKNQKITLAEYRDLLETSRRPAMSILDHFDEKKIT